MHTLCGTTYSLEREQSDSGSAVLLVLCRGLACCRHHITVAIGHALLDSMQEVFACSTCLVL